MPENDGPAPGPPLPSITRGERLPFLLEWVGGLSGGIGLLLLWFFVLDAKPWPWLTPAALALLGLAVLPWLVRPLRRWWPGRRRALRVDAAGVHEVFGKGRERTLRWDEIERLERAVTSTGRPAGTLRSKNPDARPLVFTSQLENAYAIAAVIHARLHGLPLLAPGALPAPTREELHEALGGPLPWKKRSWVGAVSVIGLLNLAFNLLPRAFPPRDPIWHTWVTLALGLASLALVGWIVARLPYRLEIDEKEIRTYSLLRPYGRIRWEEVTGRVGPVVKGLHHDLELPQQWQETRTLLELIDRLVERRAAAGGPRLGEPASAASLLLVDPETAGEISRAALVEVERPEAGARRAATALAEVSPEEVAPRMTGRETGERAEAIVAEERGGRERGAG